MITSDKVLDCLKSFVGKSQLLDKSRYPLPGNLFNHRVVEKLLAGGTMIWQLEEQGRRERGKELVLHVSINLNGMVRAHERTNTTGGAVCRVSKKR